MNNLETLAVRCEEATGPDAKLDADIALATGYAQCRRRTAESNHRLPVENQFGHGFFPPSYTASLDAAMTLLAHSRTPSEIMYDAMQRMGNAFSLHICFWKTTESYGQTLARFVTASALRALATDQSETKGE